jgi:hypothetical protein
MTSPWIGDLNSDSNRKLTSDEKVYNEIDADLIIKKHAMHWLICIETYNSVRKPIILGLTSTWRLVYTDTESCAYEQIGFKRLIIGFRGTHAVKDLYDDLKITMNKVFPRAEEAQKLVAGLFTQYPNYLFELCGHSLGGAIARVTGEQMNLIVVTFNAASPPTAPVVSGPKEIDYHIVFDIISAWQSPNTVRIDKGLRPIPKFWQKLSLLTWFHASFSDIVQSHKLDNFSNSKPGTLICGEEESSLLKSWVHSLPPNLRSYVYLTIFGISNNIGLPQLSGCYYGDPSTTPEVIPDENPDLFCLI